MTMHDHAQHHDDIRACPLMHIFVHDNHGGHQHHERMGRASQAKGEEL